jgi:uncharacterized protein YbjT (DUF2867 family)
MTSVTIIGGHGKIALRLAKILTRSGHDVTSWIRSADQVADIEAVGATPAILDVESMSVAEMASALSGAQAVVWSAGAGGGSPERTLAVDRDAAIRSVDAASQSGDPLYVMVSYFGASTDHGVPQDNPFHTYAVAKAAADAHLRASSLRWVVLGPGGLTDEAGTGRIEVGGGVSGGSVSRDDVAAVAAHVLEHPELAGSTIEFNNGDTPIAKALSPA